MSDIKVINDEEGVRIVPRTYISGDSAILANQEKQQTSALVPYKYDEDKILKQVAEYIDTTYQGHYVGEDNVQSLDLILATGHATGFNVGNILKYGSRYGKKRGYNRDDLLKVIHYAIFELYNHQKHHLGE